MVLANLTIGLWDDDREYMDYFSTFFHFKREEHGCVLKVFTHREALESHVRDTGRLDILLIAAGCFPQDAGNWAVFTAALGDEHSGVLPSSVTVLRRYQPLDKLLAQLSGFYREYAGVPVRNSGSRRANIIAVYSPVGGCGKTTAAINLAEALALYGKKVFLLNLESVQSPLPFSGSTQDDGYARLLYFLKSDPDVLPSKLPTLRSRDPGSKVDFLTTLDCPEEMENLTFEETRLLLDVLAKEDYDYIIVDTDGSLHERNTAVLASSHMTIWLLTDDCGCLHKARTVHTELKLRWRETGEREPETVFVVNKHTGTMLNELSAYGFAASAYLPYQPQWKSVSSPEQLAGVRSFQEALAPLVFGRLENAQVIRSG